MTKGGGGQKSQKFDDVFYEWPPNSSVHGSFYVAEILFSLKNCNVCIAAVSKWIDDSFMRLFLVAMGGIILPKKLGQMPCPA